MKSRPDNEPFITRNGWRIVFTPNVHMYCHSLAASKAGRELMVPCEDTTDGLVAICPYQLQLDQELSRELFEALREWAGRSGLRYRLHTSRDVFEPGPDWARSLRTVLLVALFLLAIVISGWPGH